MSEKKNNLKNMLLDKKSSNLTPPQKKKNCQSCLNKTVYNMFLRNFMSTKGKLVVWVVWDSRVTPKQQSLS